MKCVLAQFYPEGTSKAYRCECKLYPSGDVDIDMLGQSSNLLVKQGDYTVQPKLGNIPRELSINGMGLLSIPSDTSIDNWLHNKSANRLNAMEGYKPFVLACVLLVPALLFGIFKYGIPSFAVHFAELVPDPVVAIASEHTLLGMDKTVLEPSALDKDIQQVLQQKWIATLNALEVTERNYSLNFRHAESIGANAFALPDGTIVVTDQLVELLDNDWPMLQAILLHEIGHVEHNHSMRLIAEVMATSMAIYYFFGDLDGMIELVAGITNTAAQNQFSQKLEWEADNYALTQLQALGLEPNSFANAMEKLAGTAPDSSELDALFHSHPLIKQRIENARRLNQTAP